MSDRELLELAAKAAGVNITRWMKHADAFLIPDMKEGIGESWNPLTDDGDALRLAVKLMITVRQTPLGIDACVLGGSATFEGWGDDRAAATRRAIVRAAADIGMAMP